MPTQEEAVQQAQALVLEVERLSEALDAVINESYDAEDNGFAFDEASIDAARIALYLAQKQALETFVALHAAWPESARVAEHYAAVLRNRLLEFGNQGGFEPVEAAALEQAQALFATLGGLAARFLDTPALQDTYNYAHYDMLMLACEAGAYPQAHMLLEALEERVRQSASARAAFSLLATAYSQLLLRVVPEGLGRKLYTKSEEALEQWCWQGANPGLSPEGLPEGLQPFVDRLAEHYRHKALHAEQACDAHTLHHLLERCSALRTMSDAPSVCRALCCVAGALALRAYQAGLQAEFSTLWALAHAQLHDLGGAGDDKDWIERLGQMLQAACQRQDQNFLDNLLGIFEHKLEQAFYVGESARLVGAQFFLLAQRAAKTAGGLPTLIAMTNRLEALALADELAQTLTFAGLGISALRLLGERSQDGQAFDVLKRLMHVQAHVARFADLAMRRDCDFTQALLEQGYQGAAHASACGTPLAPNQLDTLLAMLCDRAAYAKLSAGRLRLWLATLQRLASVQGLGGVRAFFDQTESEKRFTLFGLRSRGHAQGLAQHAPNLAQNLVLALLDVLDACLKSEELALLGLQTMSTLAAVFNAQSASMRARALEKAHALYAVCQAQTHSATAYAQCKALFTL